MDKIIGETIPFYDMWLWLNMRNNSKGNMVLGESVLENKPFNNIIHNSGIEDLVKSMSNQNLEVVILK